MSRASAAVIDGGSAGAVSLNPAPSFLGLGNELEGILTPEQQVPPPPPPLGAVRAPDSTSQLESGRLDGVPIRRST